MSDSAQVLAFRVADGEAVALASRITAWLVERGVVEPTPTDCGLGALAHSPGARALDAVEHPPRGGMVDFRTLRCNGVELYHSRRPTLQSGGDEMPVFRCPRCASEIEADDVLPLLEELEDPFRPQPELSCAACHAAVRVIDLDVEGGTFANLVVRFWNWWPLTDTFVAQLASTCGHAATRLYERI